MATPRKSKAAPAIETKSVAGSAQMNASASIDEASLDSPDVTTFPPGVCSAGLPASTTFHDVTFAEFKRINRTIDDLPIPIVLSQMNDQIISRIEKYAKDRHAGFMQKPLLNAMQSGLTAMGGVPAGRFLDKSLSDLHEPLFTDIDVDAEDVYRLIDTGQITLPGAKAVKVALTDQGKADLLARQPVVVRARVAGQDVLLRLNAGFNASAVPLHNEYNVGAASDFIANPFIEATDGSLLRVSLTAAQVKSLATIGQANITVGGRKLLMRTQSDTGNQGGTVAYSASMQKIKNGGQVTDNNDGGTYTVPPPNTGGGKGAGSGTPPPPTGGGTHVPPPPPPNTTGNGTSKGPPAQNGLPLALYIPWRHRWILKGYSRGELLHSLALGPQEEVTLEISSWDRRKRSVEDSARSEFEQASEFTETSKDAQSVMREASNQTELGLTIGAEVGFKIDVVNFTGSSTANAKTAMANSSKNNLEILRESVAKASNKLKLERETKVSESSETGVENKVTRKVRNPNLCHTLTLNYHEVLAHYEIVTEFNKDDARLCVLDANPVQAEEFTYENIRYYESVLKRVLLLPDLAVGFDAARKLFAQDQLCEARRRNEMCSAVAKVSTVDDSGRQQLAALAQRAYDAYAGLKAARLNAAVVPSPWQILSPWPVMTLLLLNAAEVQKYMYLRRARSIAPHVFDVLADMASNPQSDASVQSLAEALGSTTFSTIGTSAISQDKDAMYKVLRQDLGIPAPVIFTDIPEDTYAVNDGGLLSMLNTFTESVRALGQAKELAAAKNAMEANQGAVQTDYSNKEIAEALESVQSLSNHLNRYRNYYRTCILTLMPFPDAFQNRLSMLPMIERRVLGFDNNDVALPVNAALDPRTDALFKVLVLENEELISARTSQQVTLPTSGIHVETRLGECCACEDYIDDLRSLDLRARDADIDLKRETLAQQKVETERLRARLAKGDLDDPASHPPVLRVEMPAPATPAPAVPTTPTP